MEELFEPKPTMLTHAVAAVTTVAVTRNAMNALRGNCVEQMFETSQTVRQLLQTKFGKPIKTIQCIGARRVKTDVRVQFEDETIVKLQVKHGKGGSRGWSVDRRPLEMMGLDEDATELIRTVCLRRNGGHRPAAEVPEGFLSMLLVGEDGPTHFVHCNTDSSTNEFTEFSIVSTGDLLAALARGGSAFQPKKTCVHVNAWMYLQRKGGGSRDHRPNDIQTKFKGFPEGIMERLL